MTGPDWAWAPLFSHDFRFDVHFTRFGAALRELREAGFEPEAAWATDGRELDLGTERNDARYAHILSRRVPAAGS